MKVARTPGQGQTCSVDIDPCYYYYPADDSIRALRGELTHTTRRRQQRNLRAGLRVNQCPQETAFEIDGKPYCTAHAAQFALRYLEEQA